MSKTNDHFSTVARQYAEARPTYPDALFDWLADVSPARGLAWDAGAGSGQASLVLAAHFAQVQATDISAAQLASLPAHPHVTTHVGVSSDLPDGAADLVTVAQALHWFDLDSFYAEVRRTLRPGGVIAVWSYGLLCADNEALTEAINHLHNDIVGPYWPQERHEVENGYTNLDFPFERIDAPPFEMTAQWDLHRLLGYFRSWSATVRMEKATGQNPINGYAPVLESLWGDPGQVRPLTWPLLVKAGRP